MTDREILLIVLGLVGCAAIVATAILVAAAQITLALREFDIKLTLHIDDHSEVDGEEWKRQ